MRAPVQADLIQRKLFTVHYHMYASKDVSRRTSARRRRWRRSADHTIIVYGETAAPEIRDINWLLELYQKNCRARRQGQRHPHQQHHRHPAGGGGGPGDRRGAGLCRGRSIRNLVRVLPDVPGPGFDVHLVYADALRQSKRVAAFRDFLVKGSKDWQY